MRDAPHLHERYEEYLEEEAGTREPRSQNLIAMVLYDLVDIWRETVDELGGLKGFACIFGIMMVFTLVVQYTVSKASNKRAFNRMNRDRNRKLR